jgi:hypothetical protein
MAEGLNRSPMPWGPLVLNCNLERFRGSLFQFRAKNKTEYHIIGVSLAAQEQYKINDKEISNETV